MKVRSLLFLFAILPILTHAQFGLQGSFRFTEAPKWDILDLSNNRSTDVPEAGWSAALEYAFSLPNTRLEFIPEANYTRYQTDVLDLGALDAHFYSLFFNIRAYILDLKGDCQCPTFSKKGTTLTKGFYLELSPGYTYLQSRIATNDILYKGRSTNNSLAFNAGLDVGLSRKITLSPYAGIRYYPKAIWPGLEESIANDLSIGDKVTNNYSSLTQAYIGMRLRFNHRRS